MVLGILAALAAGASFAVASVLQQRAASRRPGEESLSFRLIVHLAHQRTWLTGIGAAVLSYVLQALALSAAPLAVVQPLLVSEVVFAVPIAVRLHDMRLRVREWAGVAAVAGGLALAIASANPRPGTPLAPVTAWAPVAGAIVAVSAAAVLTGRLLRGLARPALYALAAALVMGLEAALMSATAHRFAHGVLAGVTSWEPYAMAVSSITAMLLIQSAFQAGPLAVSMPVTDVVEPLVAIGIGIALFGEHVSTSPVRLGIAAAGLAALLAGIVGLDTSPVVQRLHVRQHPDEEHGDERLRSDRRERAEVSGAERSG